MDVKWYESPKSDTTLIMSVTYRGLSFNKAFGNLLTKERRVMFGLDTENNLIVKIVTDNSGEGRKLGASNNLGFLSSSRDFERWINNVAKITPGKYKLTKIDDSDNMYKTEKIE